MIHILSNYSIICWLTGGQVYEQGRRSQSVKIKCFPIINDSSGAGGSTCSPRGSQLKFNQIKPQLFFFLEY